ncbi:MAG: hypothetical protein IJX38_03130 [Clostridia bacterium]|nr:hypothetical protein [Clostridia bacterium]
MNKKVFGIKLSVILTVVLCLLASFLIWFYIKYTTISADVDEGDQTEQDCSAAYSYVIDC